MRITRLKKKLMESEDGGLAGGILALFLLLVLIVVFIMGATHFGYTWHSIVAGFQKFFGVFT